MKGKGEGKTMVGNTQHGKVDARRIENMKGIEDKEI